MKKKIRDEFVDQTKKFPYVQKHYAMIVHVLFAKIFLFLEAYNNFIASSSKTQTFSWDIKVFCAIH